METCVRGFSYMPENKVEVMNLQYTEGGELSRAWKKSRRQRLKQLETKIWDQFVQERDIVSDVCNDDPYQFLDKVPEDCLKELLETELHQMKREKEEKEEKEMIEEGQLEVVEQPSPKQQGFNEELQEPRETMVTFADDRDDEQCDMIHIFDDERDDDGSGPEQEGIEEPVESPCTVREKPPRDISPESESPGAPVKERSTENLSDMLETSIYCAKVKDLQSKLNLELLAVITTLEAQDLNKIEPEDLPKLQRQSIEFCARYNRIYLYQMKRQIQDIVRHNNAALPFARHTFIRSQMTRSVSLQQNLLQSLQVFHKWFTQKTPLRDCVDLLKSFTEIIREGDNVCPSELHNEELLQTCGTLEGVLVEYLKKVDSYFNFDNASTVRSKKHGKSASKKRSYAQWPKYGTKLNTEAEAKLSMYSLDKLRVNSKPSSTKGNSGGTSKIRLSDAATSSAKLPENAEAAPKKKSPRARRPLMRAPGSQRKREKPREPDNIRTMVEAVGLECTSGPASREDTPRTTPPATPRSNRRKTLATGMRKKSATPNHNTPRTPKPTTSKQDLDSDDLKLALDAVKIVSDTSLSPVIAVQCDKREMKVKSAEDTTVDQQVGSSQSPRDSGALSGEKKKSKKTKKDRSAGGSTSEVSRLLKKLCAGSTPDGKNERVSGVKNAQLLCVNGGSPRRPSTPQLLRILEETIQKKAPKPHYYATPKVKDVERFRMTFNISPKTTETLFQYRTKFVQHMLSSPMYANSAVGKPWDMIGSISEQIVDEILLSCAKEMQLDEFVKELYKSEIQ